MSKILYNSKTKKKEMKKIEYTNYAEETILDRKISKKKIESVLLKPLEITKGKADRKIAHKVFEGKLLRVIFETINEKTYKVITAYYTKPERYIRK